MNLQSKKILGRRQSVDTITPSLRSRNRLSVTSSTSGIFHSHRRTIHINYLNSDPEKIHQHSHWPGGPHLHDPFKCFSSLSGYDDWREYRYYFTQEKVPIRVYIKYEKTLEAPKEKKSLRIEPSKTSNRKGDEVSISTKYIDDAKRMIYIPENKSFILLHNQQISSQFRRPLSRDSIN